MSLSVNSSGRLCRTIQRRSVGGGGTALVEENEFHLRSGGSMTMVVKPWPWLYYAAVFVHPDRVTQLYLKFRDRAVLLLPLNAGLYFRGTSEWLNLKSRSSVSLHTLASRATKRFFLVLAVNYFFSSPMEAGNAKCHATEVIEVTVSLESGKFPLAISYWYLVIWCAVYQVTSALVDDAIYSWSSASV